MTISWRKVALNVIAFGMEGCWALALLVVANDLLAKGLLPAAWMFSVYPIALLANRGLGLLHWKRHYLIALNVVLGAMAAIVITKTLLYSGNGLNSWWAVWLKNLGQLPWSSQHVAEWVVLAAVGLLWWRGLSLALAKLEYAQLVARFQFGAGLLLVLLFFAAESSSTKLQWGTEYVGVFFLLALVGLVIARAEGQPEGGLLQQHRLWLSLIAIVSVLILGMIIGSFVTQGFLRLLFTPFVLLWQGIEKVFLYLASLFHPSAEAALPTLTPEGAEPSAEAMAKAMGIPESMRKIGAIFTMGVFGIMLLLALYRLSSQVLGWLWGHMPKTSRATLESVEDGWRADLKAALLGLLRWLSLMPLWRRLKPLQSLYAARKLAPLRQLYIDLQRWAAKIGQPRQPHETPLEFMHTLGQALPAGKDDLAVITAAYVQMRYGELAPSNAQYTQIQESWKRLRRLKPSPRI